MSGLLLPVLSSVAATRLRILETRRMMSAGLMFIFSPPLLGMRVCLYSRHKRAEFMEQAGKLSVLRARLQENDPVIGHARETCGDQAAEGLLRVLEEA